MLTWRSADFLYEPATTSSLKLLMKNYKLSDDIAFRFSEKTWEGWPLTADKFAAWVRALEGNAEIVNLYMDFETLGEHQPRDSGIFEFLAALPGKILAYSENSFITPSQAIEKLPVRDTINVERLTSWADMERDLSAWNGNEMQQTALAEIYGLEQQILASNNEALIRDWRRLQTSDHFYYMCTKWFADGDVHAYFNPYDSPYEAFTSYMNVLKDLKFRLAPSQKTVQMV